MNFFTLKLMKIGWSSFFLWIYCNLLPNQVEHTLVKSQFHICNYEWAKILFVDKGLDSKLQHYGSYKISWKSSKTSHLITLKVTWCWTVSKKRNWKKVKSQNSMSKFFFSTLSFNPWAILATWLHVGAPQKIQYKKNELNTHFEQYFTMGSYGVGIGRVWCSENACEIYSSFIQKKNWKKIKFLTQVAQTTID